MWVLQSRDKTLPNWLTDNLRSKCMCGAEMENFYNPANEITARRCSDVNCPYRMAQKIVGMCEILGIKGIGEKTAYKMIKERGLKSHLEALPFISREKLKVDLYTYLRLLFVKGVSTGWGPIANRHKTLDDLMVNYNGKFSTELQERREEIMNGARLVDIKTEEPQKFEPLITGTVMISGNIKGLNNRNSFISAMNKYSNGLIHLSVAESKRKTGIMALIQEADTPNRGKAECAIENGIPIMTPDEFKAVVFSRLREKLGVGKGESV